MKTKIFFLLLVTFGCLNAQAPNQKWINVLELPDQIVYVDTSTIKQVENQISCLSISLYKQPQMIASLNKEAASIKSQILFSIVTKRYNVIGTLYYDPNMKILGETSLPGFASSSENFSSQIEGNEMMTAIYNKSVSFLNTGLTLIGEKETPKVGFKKKEPSPQITHGIKKKTDETKSINKDSLSALDRVALYLSKKDSVQKTTNQSTQINDKPIDSPAANKAELQTQKPPIDIKKKNDAVSNTVNAPEKETSPRSAIFTDGSKYSFQISSWKNKIKADAEVNRLKSAGYNAFITEGLVRGATWYRVRIGYFNSLQETEEYMKKIK